MFPQDSSDSEPEQLPPKRIKKFVAPSIVKSRDESSPHNLSVKAGLDSSSDELSDSRLDTEESLEASILPVSPKKASMSESILNPKSLGFQIMQKMGYKENSSLGSGNNPNALVEPIAVSKRSTRGGIGSKKETKLLLEKFTADKSEKYREHSKNHKAERSARVTIRKLQNFCYHALGGDKISLETENFEDIHILWRDYALRLVEQASFGLELVDEPEKEVQAELQALLDFSRKNFYYCPYCGVQYDDEKDLAAQCPGSTEALHLV